MSLTKRPAVDLGACSKCGACIELAPNIFRYSKSGDYIEVCDLHCYDQDLVDEAIKYCPEDCIYWDEE